MKSTHKKIGILTSGGDCPGLNAVIRAVFRYGSSLGYEIHGITDGWRGFEDGTVLPLTPPMVSGIINKGGTILRTSRFNPFKDPKDVAGFVKKVKSHGFDAIIACGGEGSLGIAYDLSKEGVPVIAVPKTIDNDIEGTDFTFGFDTACGIATDAVDRLHTTAESHSRVMVLEVMGRYTGWIAAYSGIAGGADLILIPEFPMDLNSIIKTVTQRRKNGKPFNVIVVAEGFKIADTHKDDAHFVTTSEYIDEGGHIRLGGVSHIIAEKIEEQAGFESRATILGHLQRSGNPSPRDRLMATEFGVHAVHLVKENKMNRMVTIQNNKIGSIPIKESVHKLKRVPNELYKLGEIFFG